MRLARDQIVDRFRVDILLGEGGAAEVYRVHHTTLGTVHALKVLSMAGDGVRRRMLREGRLQASLRHPNIVAVTDVIEVGDSIGLLMEYVRGPDLAAVLEAHRPSIDESLALFRAVCAGVGHAHEQGMIHRDLKASNVMLAPGEHAIVPKVTDFGLAKALDDVQNAHRTRTGATMGTPAYMAPEQILDASRVDRRADLWALGCLLYELVTGQRAFEAPDVVSMFNRVILGSYTPLAEVAPDVPPRVAQLIAALLEVEVADRPGDVADVVAWIDGAAELPRSGVPLGQLGPASPVVTTGPAHISPDGPTGRVVMELSGRPRSNSSTLAPDTQPLAGPTPLTDPRFHPFPAKDEPEPGRPRRRAWVLPALAAGAVAVLLLIAFGPTRTPDPVPIVPIPRPAPAPEVPAPPAPAPAVLVPVPVPAPVHAPVHAPIARPAEPRPEPAAFPAPVAAGTVEWDGASDVWFLDGSGAVVRGPSLPAGRYKVVAAFPGATAGVTAGDLAVEGGARIHLSCVAQMRRCAAR